jgi:two-component system, sensor histidine kinase
MVSQLQPTLLIGLLVLSSTFSTLSFSNTQQNLNERLSAAESWSEKQQLASQLIAEQNLPNQQLVTIYSDLAEQAFAANDLPNALKYYKLLEQSTTFNNLPELNFRAVKMQGVVLYYQGLVQQAVVEYSRALSLAVRLKSPWN